MGRYTLNLDSMANREKAIKLIRKSPPGTFLTFKRNKRSVDQNSRMWAMLSIISKAMRYDQNQGWRVSDEGAKYSPDDWKDFFAHSLSNANWMPGENGGMIPLSLRTSEMSKQEHSDLTTLIEEFAARNDIQLGDENTQKNSQPSSPYEDGQARGQ